ncbi:hypothetical protein EKD16_15855 [Streptomonospora litoralis]|uniref:Uncharacterized protein n=1 Tax=Streptomonospora litoralis TaxID=2498135 RepID=A0A4P6Q327_9ACTN|nr:hypothetical protein EKD16_15855 [Streptomonospora litoralis]
MWSEEPSPARPDLRLRTSRAPARSPRLSRVEEVLDRPGSHGRAGRGGSGRLCGPVDLPGVGRTRREGGSGHGEWPGPIPTGRVLSGGGGRRGAAWGGARAQRAGCAPVAVRSEGAARVCWAALLVYRAAGRLAGNDGSEDGAGSGPRLSGRVLAGGGGRRGRRWAAAGRLAHPMRGFHRIVAAVWSKPCNRWHRPPPSLSPGLDSAPNPALETDSARLGPSIANLWSQESAFPRPKVRDHRRMDRHREHTGAGGPAGCRRVPYRARTGRRQRGGARSRVPARPGARQIGGRGRRRVARCARARPPGVAPPDEVDFWGPMPVLRAASAGAVATRRTKSRRRGRFRAIRRASCALAAAARRQTHREIGHSWAKHPALFRIAE